MRNRRLLAGIVLMMSAVPALALENERALAKASLSFLKKNHFAQYMSLPFENDTNFNYLSHHKTQNTLNFKPVVPFSLTPSYDLIVRTIAPIYAMTPIPNQQGLIRGTGDLNPTFFISPHSFNTWILGLGPTMFIPTTSNSKYLATNKWSLGPEFAAMAIWDHWMYGILTYNVYSTAANNKKIKANQFSLQYLLAYTFDNGWYVSTNPNITANWQKQKNQKWTVPFGLGGGKTFYVGKQAVNLSTHAYYNTIRPMNVGPNWQLQIELEFLFPAS